MPITRRTFLSLPAAAIAGPVRFDFSWPYHISNYVVARGNTHVHTIVSNAAADRAIIEAYLKSVRKVLKVDPDHLYAEDIDATVARANRLGLNFLVTQDHGEKLSDAHYLRQGSFHGRPYAPLAWTNSPTGVGGEYLSGFVAYRGFEWTQGGLFSTRPLGKARTGVINHVGVFGAPNLTGVTLRPSATGTLTPDFPSLCRWLATHEPGKVIASFNHPSYGDNQFGDFTVAPEFEGAKAYLRMIELGSGADFLYEGIGDNEKHYIRALQHGWRVMPTVGIDNWGKLTPAARDRHVAVWMTGFFGPNGTFFDALASCHGYGSEIRDLVVQFGLTGAHGDPAEREASEVLMGQLATPCAAGHPLKAFWQLGTTSPTRFSEISIVAVLPSRTESIPVYETKGVMQLALPSDVIGYYLKGTATGGRRFITAPVFIVHRNTELKREIATDEFGTIRAKLTGFRIDDNASPPVLLNWVPPCLELNWEDTNPDWLIEVEWQVPGDMPGSEIIDYVDLDKRYRRLFDPHYQKIEAPLERFGDYRIVVSVQMRIRSSTKRTVMTIPFRVQNQPLHYIPDRLRIFRSL